MPTGVALWRCDFAAGGGLSEPTHFTVAYWCEPDCNSNGMMDRWDMDASRPERREHARSHFDQTTRNLYQFSENAAIHDGAQIGKSGGGRSRTADLGVMNPSL